MSQKKSKSKSKEKASDKPPKDTKSKKSKDDKGDTKSKKSAGKQSKKGDKSPSKKGDSKLSKSKVSKVSSKAGLDQSQDLSFFKPILSQNLFTLDESYKLRLCQFHKQPNTIFCQICEQTGCQQCLVYGPHNNQMHRVNKIDEAFKARYLYMNELVCGQLIERRDHLNKRLGDLTVLSDQLRYIKNGIEKVTKIEYNEMLDRLRISSGGKFAVLHHEMAELQKDLENINALGNQFFELTSMNPEVTNVPQNNPNKGMVPFLLRCKFLQEQAEELISKPIKTSVDVYPYDLPRELTEKKMILEKNKKWVDLLQIKDQAIWNLVEDKKTVEKRLWSEFQQQAQSEIEEWTKLKQKISEELSDYEMKCKKCSIVLSDEVINQSCQQQGSFHDFQ